MDVRLLLGQTEIRPQIDGVRLLGAVCATYVLIFVLHFGLGAPWTQIVESYPWELALLLTGFTLTILGLLLSLRTISILGWSGMALAPGFVLDLPAFVIGRAGEIGFFALALGIPLLALLEVILTIEAATAKARVVFRGRALLKASVILTGILAALMLVFSSWDVLEQYSASPEAATFHAAIIAGLTTIVVSKFLLSRPRYEEEEA